MSILYSDRDCEIHITPIIVSDAENPHARRNAELTATAVLLHETLGDVSISHTPEGAPYVECKECLSISISHSRSYCVLAISRSLPAIGVDIENPRAQMLRVRNRFLSSNELARIDTLNSCPATTDNLPSHRLMNALTRLWTIKEAVYKAALTPGLALSEIDTDPELTHAVAKGRRYVLTLIDIPSGEILALAKPIPKSVIH